MKDRLVAFRIVFNACARELLLGRPGPGGGNGSPGSVANPEAPLLAGVANVVKADGLAVLLEFVFHLACERERLRPREIDAAILELAGVEHSDGDETAAGWFARLADPLEHSNGAQLGSVLAGLGDLTWVLGEGGENGEHAENGEAGDDWMNRGSIRQRVSNGPTGRGIDD